MLAALVTAIIGVTLIDGTGAPAKPNTTVVIEGDRIKAVGVKRIPRGAQVVDAHGKWMIPGLWDMHAHAIVNFEESFPRLLAQGITGIRDMHIQADRPFERLAAARRAAVRPRIVAAGVMVDGPQPMFPAALIAYDAESARDAVRRLKREGAGFVKAYDLLSKPAYRALIDESRRVKLEVGGHVPIVISAQEAHQRSIEHLSGIFEACSSDPTLSTKMTDAAAFWQIHRYQAAKMMQQTLRALSDSYDSERCKPLFRHFAAKQIWHCPTLAEVTTNAPRAIEVAGELHLAGVRLLAGTDNRSLVDELQLLVKAGLTPMEALQTATKNAGEILKNRKIGVIRKGAVADLVVLDADPLADIGNITHVSDVFVRGHHQTRIQSSVH